MLLCCAASNCSLARTEACLLSASQPLMARCQSLCSLSKTELDQGGCGPQYKLAAFPGNDTKLALECSIFCKPPLAYQDAMKRP